MYIFVIRIRRQRPSYFFYAYLLLLLLISRWMNNKKMESEIV